METKKEKTPTISLDKKLLLFQAKVHAVKKSADNPFFKTKYADLNAILAEVKPILTELGMTIMQPIHDGKVTSIVSDVETGASLCSAIALPENLNAQQLGSAITYFRRYTLTSLLALETADDDGTEATELPYLNKNTENYYKVVDALTNGKATVTQVKIKYKLSKEMETELNNINK